MSIRPYSKSILQAVHETAEDFRTVGMIDQRTMREFNHYVWYRCLHMTGRRLSLFANPTSSVSP